MIKKEELNIHNDTFDYEISHPIDEYIAQMKKGNLISKSNYVQFKDCEKSF